MKHTVDCIIRSQGGIVVIERSKPPFGLALPGGHVEDNETLEQTVEREMREETRLHLANLQQFRTYSEPDRDPRGRVISTVFTADGYGTLKAGDDAKHAQVVPLANIDMLANKFAFDHYRILSDYRREHALPQTVHTAMSDDSGTYYVVFHRDAETEKWKKYTANRQLFDYMRTFSSKRRAINFAESNMPAIVAKKLYATDADCRQQYIVIVQHHGKFSHTDYTGDTDWLITHDVIKCGKEELSGIVENAAREKYFKKLWRGHELQY